ncbi:protein of unknown function (DUF1906) [Desulfosporosinus acidiphilus SJ4]|uniref:Rv2525c-like glycoside hydrolase-like domain-containing protein n=1 Tax=Desulfosporosinus acidiphilus (strain DSM 22704 / JCM 16185 / SJ4) TaxID=646529 RepID=I4D0Q9_DESAJ|nr:DUF1906 domain-containing protein [Desulfosporosinus acidiphilus]AFM39383.1 protein of unknown function (DUF1906) [Desulfosporosinus acidiphilus SJ4]
MNGIDCVARLDTTGVQNLKKLGNLAIGRYLGYTLGWPKSLTPDEVKVVHDAGLAIFLIWESNPTSAGYFSYDKGVADAKQAITEAGFLNVPSGTAIYFTVDFDAQAGDMAVIQDYFRGVRDGLSGQYLTGIYGSFSVMKTIQADRYFQTYAWSAGQVAPNHIYQYNNNVSLAGILVDQDYVNNDAGLWKGSADMGLNVAVLLYTKEDFWSGYDVAVKNGNCALFVRPDDHSVPKDAMSAAQLIVVGGSTTGHPNEVLLSGTDKYGTAAAVKKYLG